MASISAKVRFPGVGKENTSCALNKNKVALWKLSFSDSIEKHFTEPLPSSSFFIIIIITFIKIFFRWFILNWLAEGKSESSHSFYGTASMWFSYFLVCDSMLFLYLWKGYCLYSGIWECLRVNTMPCWATAVIFTRATFYMQNMHQHLVCYHELGITDIAARPPGRLYVLEIFSC